jgi:hypothetical protein
MHQGIQDGGVIELSCSLTSSLDIQSTQWPLTATIYEALPRLVFAISMATLFELKCSEINEIEKHLNSFVE